MPKIGGRRKKVRSHKQPDVVQEKLVPKTFVFKRGKCSNTCNEVTRDFRKCFYPNTAMKLEDSNKLAIKSYLKAASYYSVTHLVALQQSNSKTYLRMIKLGGGEMLFRVMNYCRMKDVLSNGGHPFNLSFQEPLVVLSNFTENNQVRQIGRSIQEMFPNINLDKIKINNMKRVISFTYQPNKKCIYFRHYKIIFEQGGVENSFKELLKKDHEDISQFKSFSEYLASKNGREEHITEQKHSQNQTNVKLVQIGPRLKLKFLNFKQNFGRVAEEEENQEQKSQNHGKQQMEE